jgi:hypothetical protein
MYFVSIGTICKALFGKPLSRKTSPSRIEVKGVRWLGLIMIEFPAASAGATL